MKTPLPDLMNPPLPPPPPVPTSIAIVADPALPKLNVVDVFAALGNPIRWRAIELMAAGEFLTATQVAKAVQRDFDGVSKHLRLMRAAGVLASQPAPTDKRHEFYYIPPQFRPMPGVVDYGCCVLRFPAAV